MERYCSELSKCSYITQADVSFWKKIHPQDRYKRVTYELAGVNPDVTRFFTLDRDSGVVTVQPAMATDQATTYTVLIYSYIALVKVGTTDFCNLI